jgi:hypothetical protein
MILKQWIISLFLILLSFVLGFYTAIYLQQESSVTNFINILPIVTGLGAGIGIVKVIADWIVNRKKIPLLDYGEIIKKNMQYYIRIKKTKGEELAKSVRGFITIENTEIKNAPMTWDYEYTNSIDISHYRDLNLFINNTPSIKFQLVNEDEDKNWFNALIGIDFDKIKAFETSNKISIQLQSENAKLPSKPFVKSFENIRLNAIDETIAKIEDNP